RIVDGFTPASAGFELKDFRGDRGNLCVGNASLQHLLGFELKGHQYHATRDHRIRFTPASGGV
ncbi:MAG: hypothetical protein WB755_13710, partial [Terriglobales bacterium]